MLPHILITLMELEGPSFRYLYLLQRQYRCLLQAMSL